MVKEGQNSVRYAKSATADPWTVQPFFLRCKFNIIIFNALKAT
jgi:hypothetical protein